MMYDDPNVVEYLQSPSVKDKESVRPQVSWFVAETANQARFEVVV